MMRRGLIFIVAAALLAIGYGILNGILELFDDTAPVVYGLDQNAANSCAYLPPSDPGILPPDTHTVALYSIRSDTVMLERIFKTTGIPYFLPKKLQDAAGSAILFLDFDIQRRTALTSEEVAFLRDFVAKGGTLIGNEIFSITGGTLKEIFGYRDFKASRTHKQLLLLPSPFDAYLNRPEERAYRLSSLDSAPFTNAIRCGTAIPIARYEDKSAAITLNRYGKGTAVLLGISLFDLRYRNLFGKDYSANKHYCNGFEPLSDMIIMMLKGIYERTLPQSMTLATAPEAFRSTVILTHDVDYEYSMRHIEKFARLESSLGVRSTFMILTKYVTDYKDIAFFNPDLLHYLNDAADAGFEIGSHTVLHTKNFFNLPEGNYTERYPAYRPFSLGDYKDTGNPTLSGELKVSKELLLGSGIKSVRSFRSGELLYNPKLPQAMERLGYRYSSCFSAEDVLSYFPYRYIRNYSDLSDESTIWEFPLAYEDEAFPPLYFRTDKALDLQKKIHENGGVFTMLIHPDLTLSRLKNLDLYFLDSFVKGLPKGVWIDTMEHVGEFWDRRDRIVFRYEITAKSIILNIYSAESIKGVGLDLHHVGLNTYGVPSARLSGDRLILDITKGVSRWEFDRL